MGEAVTRDLKSNYLMALIEGSDLERFWPGVDGMMEKLPHTIGHWTRDELRAGVYAGHFQLWGVGPGKDAIFMLLTNIAFYPSKRVFMIGWGAGSFHMGMVPVIEATLNNFAALQGCSVIEVHGRTGWSKALERVGFHMSKVVFERPVHVGGLH